MVKQRYTLNLEQGVVSTTKKYIKFVGGSLSQMVETMLTNFNAMMEITNPKEQEEAVALFNQKVGETKRAISNVEKSLIKRGDKKILK